MKYAGFWPRFFAWAVDAVILGILSVVLNLLMIPIAIAYGVVPPVMWGGTPGKLLLGLRIVKPDGSPIGYKESVIRWLATALSGLILGIGYLMIAWDPERRALHDRIAGTRVIFSGEKAPLSPRFGGD